jgi:hypothetical protein
MGEMHTFLEAVHGYKPEGLYILLWEKLEKKLSYWFDDWKKAADFGADHAVNLYMGVNLSGKDYGLHRRCVSAQIAAQVALIADIDIAGPAHKSKDLPPTFDDAVWLLPEEFEPSILIHSGNGLQAWWLLKAPTVFEDDLDRDFAQTVATKWHEVMKQRAATKGWALDPVYDLARVLRVPGTTNRKQDCPDTEARILAMNESRYNISELSDWLDSMPLPLMEETAKKKIERVALMPAAPGSFVYDPNSILNGDIHRALWENDIGFRLTWSVKRTDFKDQSQSSYDLALANIFYNAGVSDQETVNALVHHRRARGFNPKPDPNYYYRRTLSMARAKSRQPAKRLQEEMEAIVTGKLASDDTLVEQAEQQVKPPMKATEEAAELEAIIPKEKASCLVEFNRNLRLRIDGKPVSSLRNVWVRGTDPTWRMELDTGEIVTFSDAKDWATHEAMANTIAGQVNGIIVVPNRKTDWAKFIKPLFQHSLVEETAGEENDIRGVTRELLNIYFRQRGIIPLEAVWSDVNNLYLPTVIRGQIAVYAQDVCDSLNRSTGDKHEKHKIISGLSALKATREKINGPRGQSQSRYVLPEDWKPEDLNKIEAATRLGIPEEGAS